MKRIYIPAQRFADIDLSKFHIERAGLAKGGHIVYADMTDSTALRFFQLHGDDILSWEDHGSDILTEMFKPSLD